MTNPILCTYRQPFEVTPAVAWMPAGLTLQETVERFAALPPEFAAEGTICLNGEAIPRHAWTRLRTRAPRPGKAVELTFHLPPRGGRQGGKQILGLIASFALTFGAGWIAQGGLATRFGLAKFAAGSTAAFLAAAGVQIVGSLLISALIPPPQASQVSRARFRNEGAASAQGNVLDPNGPLPRVVGRRKVFPPLALEPFTYFDGDDEVVEALYVLGGPHQLSDIRIGAASVDSLSGCEIETREGWPGDAPLTLIRRMAKTEALQSELRGHSVDEDAGNRLDTTLEVATALPQPMVVATRDRPDEHQLHLIFAQGLHYEGGATLLRVPVRLRLRRRGDTTWRNLPELHFQAGELRQLRTTIRLIWSAEVVAPAAASSQGWVEARRSCPDQIVEPAGGGWTADPAFGSSGDAWMTAQNLGSTGVTGVELSRYEARIHLDPALWPPGQWEIEIVRGAAFTATSYTSATYSVGGSVWALFGYRTPAAPEIVRSRDRTSDSLMLLRSVSIRNAAPVVPGDIALIAIRARNRALDRVSVLAGGWVQDWDGTDWRAWTVTDNPAPHIRDILTGRFNPDPLSPALLDQAGLLEFRQHCADKGYRVRALLEGESVPAALEIVAACGYARPYKGADRWGVVMDRDRSAEAPVQVFSPRNMAGFTWHKAMLRLPDGLRVTFRDADRDYEARQITVLRAGGKDSGLLEQIEYEGLVTEDEVRARAAYDLSQLALRSTDYTFEAPAEAIVCRHGSLVAVTHETIGAYSTAARVANVWLDDAGALAALDLDTEVPVYTRPGFDLIADLGAVDDMGLIGARSAVMIRRNTGAITLHEVTDDGATDQLTLAAPADAEGVDPDVLVIVGQRDRHHLRALVKDIKPKEDFRMAITLVDEAPELHANG